MDYKIELTEQPAQPVLSMRTRNGGWQFTAGVRESIWVIIEYLNELGEKPIEAAFAA